MEMVVRREYGLVEVTVPLLRKGGKGLEIEYELHIAG